MGASIISDRIRSNIILYRLGADHGRFATQDLLMPGFFSSIPGAGPGADEEDRIVSELIPNRRSPLRPGRVFPAGGHSRDKRSSRPPYVQDIPNIHSPLSRSPPDSSTDIPWYSPGIWKYRQQSAGMLARRLPGMFHYRGHGIWYTYEEEICLSN